MRDYKLAWAVEAKQRDDEALTTILSKEVFQELIRFERWLYFDLKYYNVPGIPAGDPLYDQDLVYDEKPEYITWHDVCMK